MYKDTHKDIILHPRKAITMLKHLKNVSSILGRQKLKILHPRISFISLIRTYYQAKSIIIWLCSCPFGKYHPLLQSGLHHNAPKMAGVACAHEVFNSKSFVTCDWTLGQNGTVDTLLVFDNCLACFTLYGTGRKFWHRETKRRRSNTHSNVVDGTWSSSWYRPIGPSAIT